MSHPLCQVIIHGVLVDRRGELQPLQVTPREVEVELNDYRTADGFRVTIGGPEFPFDPRQFTALAVDVYLGPAGADGSLPLNDSTILLSGFVDKPSTTADDKGVSVTLEGRDFTCLFLDTRWGKTIQLGRLSTTLRSVVDQVPGAGGMEVVLEGLDDVQLAIPGGRSRYTPPRDIDAWSVITELVRMAGGVVFVRRNQVVASGPANLFPADKAPTFLWGRDLARLEYGTELKNSHNRGVRVTCRDPQTGALGEAFYPPKGTRLPGGPRKHVPQAIGKKAVVHHSRRKVTEVETYIDWILTGIPKERLESIAKQIWELQARASVEGSLELTRLTALDDQAPIWRLRHSSPIRIVTPAGMAGQLATLPESVAVANLTSGPYRMRRPVAQAFVQAAKSLQANDAPWYVQKATHRWSAESGYTCNLNFINFVTVSP